MVYVTIVNGDFKPTYSYVAPPCMDFTKTHGPSWCDSRLREAIGAAAVLQGAIGQHSRQVASPKRDRRGKEHGV